MSEEYGGGDVNYSYQYSVNDKYSGAKYNADESRSVSGTTGSYTVLLPDGRTKTVTYTVKDPYSGFVADVVYSGEAATYNKPVPVKTYTKPAPVPVKTYSKPAPPPTYTYKKAAPSTITYTKSAAPSVTYTKSTPSKVTYTPVKPVKKASTAKKITSKPVASTFKYIINKPTSPPEPIKYSPAPAPKYSPAPAPTPRYSPAPAPTSRYSPAPDPAPRIYTLHKSIDTSSGSNVGDENTYTQPIFYTQPSTIEYAPAKTYSTSYNPSTPPAEVRSLQPQKSDFKNIPEALVYKSKLNFVS